LKQICGGNENEKEQTQKQVPCGNDKQKGMTNERAEADSLRE
jgi:hypothetical protein